MPAVQDTFTGTPFLSIVGGKLVRKVEPGTPGAKERVNKLGATVFEINYDAWSGIVKDWNIVDSEYGKTLHVKFDDVTLSLGGKSQSEFIKKFASADFSKEIVVKPYDFITDQGERKSGLNIYQNEQKLRDFFSDYNAETRTFTQKNLYPVPPTTWDKMTEAQKKIYYITTEEFLQTFVATNPINNIGAESTNAPDDIPTINLDDEKEDVKIDEIPF